MTRRLPAEWEKQDGILLSWPHRSTDWAGMLDEVEPVFVQIARAVSRFQPILILAPDAGRLEKRLAAAGVDTGMVRLYQIDTNDTWCRDYGPITVYDNGHALPLDFIFDGWGGKFAARLDNGVTNSLGQLRVFSARPDPVEMVFEGGSIDTDGKGTLLTTTRCLLNPNRNPELDRDSLEARLKELFGLKRILWLESGMLLGDDTDAHVDILARFAPGDTILHVACDDRSDPHYRELGAMLRQLESFRTDDGGPYRLVPLPLPREICDADGNRLAATYANFLVINGAVLVPTYDDDRDSSACAAIEQAFPGREVIGIDCLPLIRQGGSLHCSTMHFPEGVLT